MVFPDDEREANPASFKFLEMAHKWKRMQQTKAEPEKLSEPLSASKAEDVEKRPSPASSKSDHTRDDNSDAEMASSGDEDL